jgi:NAD(P)-dependent dehydrogenase (short-subunit alcohol dehydrogenase family)
MTTTRAHLDRGPVALFAGATAGLGEATLRAYAAAHRTARIYFVGRNAAAAARIQADVRRAWGEGGEGAPGSGDLVFIKADLSLIANGRAVRDAFVAREGEGARLDFLYMSQGILTVRPRTGTLDCFLLLVLRGLYTGGPTPALHSIAQKALNCGIRAH